MASFQTEFSLGDRVLEVSTDVSVRARILKVSFDRAHSEPTYLIEYLDYLENGIGPSTGSIRERYLVRDNLLHQDRVLAAAEDIIKSL